MGVCLPRFVVAWPVWGDSPSEHNLWFLKELSDNKFEETHFHHFLKEFSTQRNTRQNISTTVWCVFPADDAVEREQDRVPRDPPRPRQRPTSVSRVPRRPSGSPRNHICPEGRPRVKHQRGKPARRGQLLSESVACEKNRTEGERKMRHDGRVTHSGMGQVKCICHWRISCHSLLSNQFWNIALWSQSPSQPIIDLKKLMHFVGTVV